MITLKIKNEISEESFHYKKISNLVKNIPTIGNNIDKALILVEIESIDDLFELKKFIELLMPSFFKEEEDL